ncbi:MAG TPA: c-type cytochrome [Candidatus Angelobacter sp.]
MRKSLLAVLTLLAAAVAGLAQSGQKTEPAKPVPASTAKTEGAAKPGVKTAEQQFKNIQALKGVPADQIIPAMQYFNASLGVECNFCHVREQQQLAPDKDDKEEKRTARQMIAMTQAINQNHFKGQPEVGCATCHSGLSRPRSAPPLVEEKPKPPQFKTARGQQLPSVEEIAQAYEKAIGGKEAIQKLSSRSAKASVTTAQGQTLHIEAMQKAPDKALSVVTFPNGQVREQGFNGVSGWTKTNRGVNEAGGEELAGLKISARFFRDLTPVAVLANARVLGTDVVDGHDCYVIRGQYPETDFSERLYFDKQSGMLLRRATVQRTLFGPLVDTTDFSDYKDVQGVKVAFTTKRTTAENVLTRKLESVEFNQVVDDAKFARPVVQGGATR